MISFGYPKPDEKKDGSSGTFGCSFCAMGRIRGYDTRQRTGHSVPKKKRKIGKETADYGKGSSLTYQVVIYKKGRYSAVLLGGAFFSPFIYKFQQNTTMYYARGPPGSACSQKNFNEYTEE